MARCKVCGCGLAPSDIVCPFCGAPAPVTEVESAAAAATAPATAAESAVAVGTAAAAATAAAKTQASKPSSVERRSAPKHAAKAHSIEGLVPNHAAAPLHENAKTGEIEGRLTGSMGFAQVDEPVEREAQLSSLDSSKLTLEAETEVRKAERERKKQQEREAAKITSVSDLKRKVAEKVDEISADNSEFGSAENALNSAAQAGFAQSSSQLEAGKTARNVKTNSRRIVIIAAVVVVIVIAAIVVGMVLSAQAEQQRLESARAEQAAAEQAAAWASSDAQYFENYGTTPAASQGGGKILHYDDVIFYATDTAIYRVGYADGKANAPAKVADVAGASSLNLWNGALYFMDNANTTVYKIENASSAANVSAQAVYTLDEGVTAQGMVVCQGALELAYVRDGSCLVGKVVQKDGVFSFSASASLQTGDTVSLALSDDGICALVNAGDRWSMSRQDDTSFGFGHKVSQVGHVNVAAYLSEGVAITQTGVDYVELRTFTGGSTKLQSLPAATLMTCSFGMLTTVGADGVVRQLDVSGDAAQASPTTLNIPTGQVKALGKTIDGFTCVLYSDGTLYGLNADTNAQFQVKATS